MGRDLLEIVAVLDHPRELLWSVVSDIESYPRYVREISWCGALDPGAPKAGSHYDMRFSLDDGPMVRNDVEILVCRPPEHLVMVSQHWAGGHMVLRLTPLGSERTELQLTITPPQTRPLTAATVRQLGKRARSAIQLIEDHLSGVPVDPPAPHEPPSGRQRVSVLKVLTRAGVLTPRRPWPLLRQLASLVRSHRTLVGAYRASAALVPRGEAISDEHNAVTFADLDHRTNRLANALTEYGVQQGRHVLLLCRNHSALVESVLACGRLGAHALILDTELPPAQMNEVIRRYRPVIMIADGDIMPPSPALVVIRTWGTGTSTVARLIEHGSTKPVKAPRKPGRVTVLTPGKAGKPQGPGRRGPHTPRMVAAVLARIPLREGERMVVAAPLFGSWAGLAAMQLGLPLRATLVLQRHFSAEQTLRLIEKHRATSLFTEPAVLRRIMELPPRVLRKYDTSSLRVVATTGPSLSPELVTEFMDEFGDVLYNLYGSAAVSWTSIAGPAHLRAAPTTAGRPLTGSRVEIQDSWGRPVAPGVVGEICVGDDLPGRNRPDNLLRTGDQGYLNADGRLFVAGHTDPVAQPESEGADTGRLTAPGH